MKVLFPDIRGPGSGRGFFLNALADELPKHGVEVVFDGDHDVSLHSIRMFCKSKKPRILRLDGVYHDTGKDWIGKNAGLIEHASRADGIICQSEFSKQMVMRFLNVSPAKIQVIFNGARPKKRMKSRNGKTLIAASKWRPHKRLGDIIGSFILAAMTDTRLLVYGDISKADLPAMKYGDSVTFMGACKHDDLCESFSSACASVHLCWFDACPNSVVEAIVAGCPVICNNTGGTHEIVRPSGGIVLDLDADYDYRAVDLYHPPKIDRHKVAEAMRRCAENPLSITCDHVNIKNIARQYKCFFERFVG
jgi:glycosyltransferase involved in cell wall biosynthesis